MVHPIVTFGSLAGLLLCVVLLLLEIHYERASRL